MATTTYEPIESKTLGSATNAVTFSSIPQTYTDLVLVVNGSTSYNSSADAYQLSFNGATTGLSVTRLAGTGSSTYSDRYSTPYAGWISTEKGADIINIMNYSNTTTYKTAITRSSSQGSYPQVGATVVLWQSTNAITSVTVTDTSGNWQSGSTFTLYGIANADSGAKATGGVITYDSTYYYHTFGASGTFTPNQNLTNVDYLVIAGGASGSGGGGGGGAGGLRSTVDVTGGGASLESKISLTSGTAYTVTVGAGGAATVNTYDIGNAGGNSSIAGSGLTTITSTGGGGGGGADSSKDSRRGQTGGSGGGGAYNASAGEGAGGARTASPVQGYDGGSVISTAGSGALSYSAGGGGAGAVGANITTSSTASSAGGIGVSIPSIANVTGTGVSTYYAGGGGGGTAGSGSQVSAGGLGGGGRGYTTAGERGVVNTGGGGGGTGGQNGSSVGGAGGSGLVVIRYAKA